MYYSIEMHSLVCLQNKYITTLGAADPQHVRLNLIKNKCFLVAWFNDHCPHFSHLDVLKDAMLQPSETHRYSVSDAVATYYLYMKVPLPQPGR